MELSTEPTITIPAVNVVGEQARAIAFVTVELAIVRRLTGWRRDAMVIIIASNVARMGRTMWAVNQHVAEQRRQAEEDAAMLDAFGGVDS